MSDAGKTAALRADLVAKLSPLLSIDAPLKLKEIKESLDPRDLAVFDAVQKPCIGLGPIESVRDRVLSVGGKLIGVVLVVTLFFIDDDSQDREEARARIETRYELVRDILNGADSPPDGGGRRWRKLKELPIRQVVEKKSLLGIAQYRTLGIQGS